MHVIIVGVKCVLYWSPSHYKRACFQGSVLLEPSVVHFPEKVLQFFAGLLLGKRPYPVHLGDFRLNTVPYWFFYVNSAKSNQNWIFTCIHWVSAKRSSKIPRKKMTTSFQTSASTLRVCWGKFFGSCQCCQLRESSRCWEDSGRLTSFSVCQWKLNRSILGAPYSCYCDLSTETQSLLVIRHSVEPDSSVESERLTSLDKVDKCCGSTVYILGVGD